MIWGYLFFFGNIHKDLWPANLSCPSPSLVHNHFSAHRVGYNILGLFRWAKIWGKQNTKKDLKKNALGNLVLSLDWRFSRLYFIYKYDIYIYSRKYMQNYRLSTRKMNPLHQSGPLSCVLQWGWLFDSLWCSLSIFVPHDFSRSCSFNKAYLFCRIETWISSQATHTKFSFVAIGKLVRINQ